MSASRFTLLIVLTTFLMGSSFAVGTALHPCQGTVQMLQRCIIWAICRGSSSLASRMKSGTSAGMSFLSF